MLKINLTAITTLALMSLGFSNTQAASIYDTAKAADIVLQGGSNSAVIWPAPASKTYKVYVQVTRSATATNALYRIYPNGKAAGNTSCSSTDATYPCIEVPINQALNRNRYVQLTVNSDTNSSWTFSKNIGYLTVNASNLASTEVLGLNVVRFEPVNAVPVFPTTGYSKVSNSGKLLADSAVLGSGANDWACTRDNRSGLIWEVKTADKSLRDRGNTYTYYNTDSSVNGGSAGTRNGGICTGDIFCDTESYTTAVNSQTLCGFNDWRMPTQNELSLLVSRIYSPTINPTYFPNTPADFFWSSSGGLYNADGVSFSSGNNNYHSKGGQYYVRLVRNSQ
jgi:hypothetical protein